MQGMCRWLILSYTDIRVRVLRFGHLFRVWMDGVLAVHQYLHFRLLRCGFVFMDWLPAQRKQYPQHRAEHLLLQLSRLCFTSNPPYLTPFIPITVSVSFFRKQKRACTLANALFAQKPDHSFLKMAKPFRQGGLDGLCGLYSVINSIKTVCKNGITTDEYEQLTQHLARSVINAKFKDYFIDGMDATHIDKMLKAAKKRLMHRPSTPNKEGKVCRNKGFRFSYKKIVCRSYKEFKSTIKKHFDQSKSERKYGKSIIIGVHGKMMHWTSIWSMTEAGVNLCDSGGLKRLVFSKTAWDDRVVSELVNANVFDNVMWTMQNYRQKAVSKAAKRHREPHTAEPALRTMRRRSKRFKRN